MDLHPGGQEPVARTECRGGRRFAWLYRIDLAKPKLLMNLAKEAALDKAMAKHQTCGACGRRYFHGLPLKTFGALLGVLRRHTRRPRLLHRSPGQAPAGRLIREDTRP
ncbi:RRQRL motif-containing zinc-binding protein [Streptomyces roseolilacinus]|uniref:RRQRL motif-containing zinc-binding protein n=1 Tax=Streptomyces roseolilacinus TaxID=66904 RepID=UPI00382F54E3